MLRELLRYDEQFGQSGREPVSDLRLGGCPAARGRLRRPRDHERRVPAHGQELRATGGCGDRAHAQAGRPLRLRRLLPERAKPGELPLSPEATPLPRPELHEVLEPGGDRCTAADERPGGEGPRDDGRACRLHAASEARRAASRPVRTSGERGPRSGAQTLSRRPGDDIRRLQHRGCLPDALR